MSKVHNHPDAPPGWRWRIGLFGDGHAVYATKEGDTEPSVIIEGVKDRQEAIKQARTAIGDQSRVGA